MRKRGLRWGDTFGLGEGRGVGVGKGIYKLWGEEQRGKELRSPERSRAY